MGVMRKAAMALVKAEPSEAQLEEGEQLRISGLKGWALVKEFWDWTHTLERSRRPGRQCNEYHKRHRLLLS